MLTERPRQAGDAVYVILQLLVLQRLGGWMFDETEREDG